METNESMGDVQINSRAEESNQGKGGTGTAGKNVGRRGSRRGKPRFTKVGRRKSHDSKQQRRCGTSLAPVQLASAGQSDVRSEGRGAGAKWLQEVGGKVAGGKGAKESVRSDNIYAQQRWHLASTERA